MSILNKNIIETKFQESISGMANTTNSLSFLVSSQNVRELQSNTYIESVTCSVNLPTNIDPYSQIYYVKDVDTFVIPADDSNWYTLNGIKIPSESTQIVYSWGANYCGKLGDGTVAAKCSPVSVIGGFTDWCQVSLGVDHTIAMRTNGTLWSWGSSSAGVLGDGTTVSKSSPVSVIGGFTDWCQISAGRRHNAAIRTNGTLWTWGSGGDGRLGDGTTTNQCSPVSVVGNFTDWCQVSASCHTAAVRTNGTLWTWGCNLVGQLGNNTTNASSSPVSVVGGFTDWCQVSVGYQHTVAVRTNGTLWAWGEASCGRLGNNCTTDRSSPVSVVGGFVDWCQVSAGDLHTVAVKTDGTLWAWGSGSLGRLGDGTTVSKSSPVSVVGGFTDWCQVSASGEHTAAVKTDGTLWVWGSNCCGQIGNGVTSLTSNVSPVSLIKPGLISAWSLVSAGGNSTVAILTDLNYR